ncbi:MAG: hypothetical protein E7G62_26465, partial [Klebsiella grimontii]|nr:hypothetical protein [Klebsiella grimontii]
MNKSQSKNRSRLSPVKVLYHHAVIAGAFCGLAPIFPDTFYRLTHYWFAAADIPVANDIPVH